RDLLAVPFSNPLTGPIRVKGAERGDTLIVDIKRIRSTIGQGATYIAPSTRYISSIPLLRLLDVELPHMTRICPIKGRKVYFSDKIMLPFKPMIGTIGVAPEFEAVSSRFPGPHGGNMDIPDIGIGSRLHLPVYVEGALLYLGDVHAAQGEGESPSGVAIEMPAEVTLTVDVIKDKVVTWPRLETSKYIGTIVATGTNRTLEDAVKTAFIELVFWLEKEYGFNRWDAYQLCTQVSKVRLGNLWTVSVEFPKRYL
ncbi:acetamidase/formamidase family protein, partial [Candidatus Bathyarchaeota archaeon]|nr:acetamidase/formamidase family protein [Candidatus Bathyarchaeota archaeon]